ncbi:sigma-70 family RNA polymerase sigma factor [Anaerocolumna sp.]|uniref:sigma-70 family RNA polymerase sigma factor n=1 Tax=Anaerocolumna sp. TaxID=2041569 RepID=UPI0028AEADAD|nr:sigma-70 family RNA polymerase sigma factor [Anaerocolumna sp.]
MMLRNGKRQAKEVYLYEPIGSDKEGHEINLLDIIESADMDIVDELELQGNIKRLYTLVDKVLTKRERQIIEMRYGLNANNEVTQREIANIIGISRSYVSRIEKKALKKLREGFEKG